MLDWDNLRLFAALHRHKSFLAAGRVVGVDATTLSRRLGQLEDQLGVLLFQRTTSGLVATDAGNTIVDHVVRIERQIDLAREDATGDAIAIRGSVRLALTDEMAAALVIPNLPALRTRHPQIDLELVVADAYVDLARGDADIALRVQHVSHPPAPPAQSVELTTRRVTTMHVGVYASRSYLKQRGRPRDAHAMEDHDLVLTRHDGIPLPGAAWMARVRTVGHAVVRTDAIGSIRAALVAGLGIGALPVVTALREPELVLIAPSIEERAVWLVAPADLARVARVRAVWEHLVETATAFNRKMSALGWKMPKR